MHLKLSSLLNILRMQSKIIHHHNVCMIKAVEILNPKLQF